MAVVIAVSVTMASSIASHRSGFVLSFVFNFFNFLSFQNEFMLFEYTVFLSTERYTRVNRPACRRGGFCCGAACGVLPMTSRSWPTSGHDLDCVLPVGVTARMQGDGDKLFVLRH